MPYETIPRDKRVLNKPTIDDFKEHIAFSQSQALKNIEHELSAIAVKRLSQGCWLSGGTIIRFGRKASEIIDTYSNELLRDVSDFSDKLGLSISDLVNEVNTTVIQLKLKLLLLKPVETLEKNIERTSVKTDMIKLMDDAVKMSNMKLKKLELGLRQHNQPYVIRTTQNFMNIENFQGQFQQGDHNNLSISNSPINFPDLKNAIENLEYAIKENLGTNQHSKLAELQIEVGKIKHESQKKNPDETIIVKAVGSLQRIIEGGVGGVLATQLPLLLPAILAAVGITV